MAVLVSANQVCNREMRIKLRRGDATVSQKLLDIAQIGAAIEQVRREGMPQRVAMHAAEFGATRDVADDQIHCVRTESATTVRRENQSARAASEMRSKRSGRFASKKHDALFVALPEHADLARIEIHVFDA